MAKVIFTYYPLSVYYNHGVSVLSAICKERGIETHIVPMGAWFEEVVKKVNPDYVCMSFVTKRDYDFSVPYINLVQKLNIPILAGGVYLRRNVKIRDDFDYACRGEGELLPDFLLNGDTTIFDENYFCDDITELPLPDYSNIDGTEFERGMGPLKDKKIIPYVTSRGCPHHCSFCIIKELPKKIRIKNTIKQDLDTLYSEFKPDLFHLMDELIPYYDSGWRDQMEGNKYPFFAFIRADIKKDELLFLKDNGLSVCAFGVESGDEKFRNEVLKKNLTDIQLFETVRLLKEFKIDYIPFFMTGNEPDEVKWKTFEMFESIGGEPVIWQYENM